MCVCVCVGGGGGVYSYIRVLSDEFFLKPVVFSSFQNEISRALITPLNMAGGNMATYFTDSACMLELRRSDDELADDDQLYSSTLIFST